MLIISLKGDFFANPYVFKKGEVTFVPDDIGERLLRDFGDRFEVVKPSKEYKVRKVNTFTDIIIPTYKNEEYTTQCFESIRKCTTEGTYRIIWVDNNSGKQSRDKVLASLKGVNHKAIFLKENKGFVGATNAGLKESKAPTVCFLNNDVIVTSGWLDKLISTLYSNDLGIVGGMMQPYDSPKPMHQSVSQQKLDNKVSKYMGDLEEYNRMLENKFGGQYNKEPEFVAFYCAVLKREVINKVGLLCEDFGVGLWDDCDYAEEAKQAGFKLGIAHDTVIFHYANATFKREDIAKTFDFGMTHYTNAKLFEKRCKERAKK